VSLVDKTISLYDFHLEKGNYYLQVVYFSGKTLIKHTIGQDQIEKDKRINNANLFLGCAISNTVTVLVD